MEVATMTDAAALPGTETYYLYHIYQVLLFIAVFLVICVAHTMFRRFFRKLFGGSKYDDV